MNIINHLGADLMKNIDLTNAKKIAKLAYYALDDKKGENIQILEIGKVSVVADYFV